MGVQPAERLLEERVAIVTGGAGGIGGAISTLFAAHGARVIIADTDAARAEATAREIADAGGTAEAGVGGGREPQARDRLVGQNMNSVGAPTAPGDNGRHYLSPRPPVPQNPPDPRPG